MLKGTANGNTQYVTKLLSDRPISSYSSNEGAQFRDWTIEQGMGIKTVKRVFSSIKAITNLAIADKGLDCSNAFAKTYFPDDEMRWLITLIRETGMRLEEAAGLLKGDIKLCETIPQIELKPHPWGSLKTSGSHKDSCH